jgi:cellulose biosynthesis protein BcsQ
VFKGSIQNRTVFEDAELAGKPVYEITSSAATEAWKDYASIGREILKGWDKHESR